MPKPTVDPSLAFPVGNMEMTYVRDFFVRSIKQNKVEHDFLPQVEDFLNQDKLTLPGCKSVIKDLHEKDYSLFLKFHTGIQRIKKLGTYRPLRVEKEKQVTVKALINESEAKKLKEVLKEEGLTISDFLKSTIMKKVK